MDCRTKRDPRLIRTDVGGRSLLADVLFARLERERERAVTASVFARADQPAAAIAADLESEGYAVHVISDHLLQVCVTDLNVGEVDGLVAAFDEVI